MRRRGEVMKHRCACRGDVFRKYLNKNTCRIGALRVDLPGWFSFNENQFARSDISPSEEGCVLPTLWHPCLDRFYYLVGKGFYFMLIYHGCAALGR